MTLKILPKMNFLDCTLKYSAPFLSKKHPKSKYAPALGIDEAIQPS